MQTAHSIHQPVAVALVACALFAAGLWPFQFFTINHAAYDRESGCLSCDRFTSAYVPLCLGGDYCSPVVPVAVQGRFSPEAQLTYPYLARILSFFDKSTQTEAITVGQWKRDLVVRVRKTKDETGLPIVVEQSVDSFFGGRSHGAITVRIDSAVISVYAGQRILRFDNPILPHTAVMLIGNSPWGDSPWNGTICLTVQENIRAAADSIAAIDGTVPALVVPRFFRPAATIVLKPLWRDCSVSNWYMRDVALNLFGFVPYGLLLTALLYRRFRQSYFAAGALGTGIGFSTSLTIELLQVYLPYRSSQMGDVVFNTLGTALGVTVFLMWKSRHHRFTIGRA